MKGAVRKAMTLSWPLPPLSRSPNLDGLSPAIALSQDELDLATHTHILPDLTKPSWALTLLLLHQERASVNT